uniref:Uncharacterized protein n=1 Tax=Halimeda minima TaxID=170427 RepID=A0A386AYZ3_9CHLO|nr:hypothetical protein [Halimeda minima]
MEFFSFDVIFLGSPRAHLRFFAESQAEAKPEGASLLPGSPFGGGSIKWSLSLRASSPPPFGGPLALASLRAGASGGRRRREGRSRLYQCPALSAPKGGAESQPKMLRSDTARLNKMFCLIGGSRREQ